MVIRKCSGVDVNISFGAWKLFEKLAKESGYGPDKLDGVADVLVYIAAKRHADPMFEDLPALVIMRDVREAFKQHADIDREVLVYKANQRGFNVLIDEGVPELLKEGKSIGFSDLDCALEWLYEGSEIGANPLTERDYEQAFHNLVDDPACDYRLSHVTQNGQVVVLNKHTDVRSAFNNYAEAADHILGEESQGS